MPLLVGLLCLAFALPAQAQSIITGSYAPASIVTMKAGIVPVPGSVVLENGSIFYDTQEFVDGSGNAIETDPSSAFINRTTLGYVPKSKFLGASFYPAFFLLLSDQPIRPVPGAERNLQLGDVAIQPIALGWQSGEWHTLVGWNLWLPTGRFEAGASNNTGKGLYSNLLYAGTTWLQNETLPWAVTAKVGYEFFGRQETTDIRPGQIMTLEFAAGKEIRKGIDLGVALVTSFQTTTESGSAPGTDTTKYRWSGISPEFNWRPEKLPGSQLSLKVTFEFDARNTSEGIVSLLSFSYMF